MKTVTAIVGSPQKVNSSTYRAVVEIMNSITSSDYECKKNIISLSDYNIQNCKGCARCFATCSSCQQYEDDIKQIEEELLKSEVIIFASPVYAHNITGTMKNFIDRIAYGLHIMRFTGKYGVTLIVDNQMDVAAPESNLVMFHRITLGTPKGTLMLTDTHGGVLWTPVFHEDLKKQDKLEYDEIFQIETQEYVNDQPIGNLGDIVTERWPNCMEYVLRKFYQDIVNENYISSENQQLLALCEIWNKIGELLGIYEKVEIQTERPCKLDNLLK